MAMRSLYIFILLTGVAFSHWTLAYEERELKRLLEKNAYPGCDLTGADLSRRALQHADLRAANLTGAAWCKQIFIRQTLPVRDL